MSEQAMEGLVKCSANYVPLTPITFLERAALVYGDNVSVVYDDAVKYTWKQTHKRCIKLASALSRLGVSRGHVVAALAPNIPALYELHFVVPMVGGVLSSLNIRYDLPTLSSLFRILQPKVLFVDYQFLNIAREAIGTLLNYSINLPHLIVISEESHDSNFGRYDYEKFLVSGHVDFEVRKPEDECDPIAISFTSGTTGIPKGVIYSHRGAYLNAMSAILLHDMVARPVYLWTVPMFHCSGWCLTWAVAAQGGTNICLRDVSAKVIFSCIARHNVTHMGGAPAVLNMIINAPPCDAKPLPRRVGVLTGGATAPPKVLFKMEELGFDVIHAYGSTEMYGPATTCISKPEWDSLSKFEQAKKKSRQGLRHIGLEEIDVKDPVTMESLPSDGKTVGEVMVRSNTVMSGYFKDEKTTKEVLRGGWYRSGDLGVKHPDGYIELKDRVQDVIRVYGQENVSTVEIENVMTEHEGVFEVAVVGMPDDRLGETPCAFVKLRHGCDASEDDIIKFCEHRLPNYMLPSTVVFMDLPKTSTGKTQKYVLREMAKDMERLKTLAKY